MSRAVCVRCGAGKPSFDQICHACGHRPEGEGLLVAWLLSENNLDAARLDAAASRVRAGESIRPSDRMIERARVALGLHAAGDPGLSAAQRAALFATSALLTPWPGLLLWGWWRVERPRTARQALWLSLPPGMLVLGGLMWTLVART